jgi:ankyrin repeat protein
MENKFLQLLKEGKDDIELIKKNILSHKELINSEIKIKHDKEELIYSPLTYCIENNFPSLSIFLIEKGADINYKTYPNEDSPLLLACKYGLEDVIKKLISQKNIDINCLNKKNETCYAILLQNVNIQAYKLIIDYVSRAKNKKKIFKTKLSFDFPIKNKIFNEKMGKFTFLYFFYL